MVLTYRPMRMGPQQLTDCEIVPVLELQGNLFNTEGALFSDRKMPNALGELKYSSSKGLLSCDWGWPAASY